MPCWDFHLWSYFCELTVFNSGFVKGGALERAEASWGEEDGLPTMFFVLCGFSSAHPIPHGAGLRGKWQGVHVSKWTASGWCF